MLKLKFQPGRHEFKTGFALPIAWDFNQAVMSGLAHERGLDVARLMPNRRSR